MFAKATRYQKWNVQYVFWYVKTQVFPYLYLQPLPYSYNFIHNYWNSSGFPCLRSWVSIIKSRWRSFKLFMESGKVLHSFLSLLFSLKLNFHSITLALTQKQTPQGQLGWTILFSEHFLSWLKWISTFAFVNCSTAWNSTSPKLVQLNSSFFAKHPKCCLLCEMFQTSPCRVGSWYVHWSPHNNLFSYLLY